MKTTNLISVLKQPGHSGCIEGICKLNISFPYVSIFEFFHREEKLIKNLSCKATFSCGSLALGEYEIRFLMQKQGEKMTVCEIFELAKGKVLVALDYQEIIVPDRYICRFRAALV